MARGILKDSPGKGQRLELETAEIRVFGDSEPEKYPLQKKGHTLEFLREIGHLRPRTNTFGAVFRLRNVLAAAVHDFFQSRGFVWSIPVITS
jgi:asparaginyl-tRNA synthetase